jgi:branched-chain amino acid transport system ATP-binding protein
MLRVEALRTGYGNVEIVHGISIAVAEGECVALIGANGAGKTTTLRAICGLLPVRSGTIVFDGAPINGLPGHAVAARGITMCPEGRQVFPEMSVLENLEMGAYRRSDGAAVRKDLDETMALFPVLRERAGQAAGTLSGGEQEMLAIGRALMARPQLCIFDEPSLGLAPKIVAEVERIVAGIKERGMTILLVEQNANMALRLADRGYVLEAGVVRIEGTSRDLRDNPEVGRAYLGH